jgi:hypothetical protein
VRAGAIGFVLLASLATARPVAAQKPASAASGPTVALQTSSGRVAGRVLDHDDQQVVVLSGSQQATVRWDDVDTTSAYEARKKILAHVRGSASSLTGEDHFHLGVFLATRDRHSAAAAEFRQAEARDSSFEPRIKQTWRDLRRAREQNRLHERQRLAEQQPASDGSLAPGVTATPAGSTKAYLQFTAAQHEEALRVYREFGQQVRDEVSSGLVLLETRHFLVWTDWPESTRNLIPDWAEQMYSALCAEFGFPQEETIWLGKCPVFCFQNKARFEKFAATFDGYSASSSLGYTKTDSRGYVHVVLRRLGSRPEDIDQFATTLVHEGTHAFMHCYVSPRKLPVWLEEGLADYVAERVVPERSHTGENAERLSRQYVEQRKAIAELFEMNESPPGEWYPIAHSLVDFMIRRDDAAFVALIDDIKGGMSFANALARHYKGMSLANLEQAWRVQVARNAPS